MKDFIGIFLFCIIICWFAAIFFLGLILNNVWALIIFIAFLLAVLITIFVKQESRIEDLEKKVEKLLNSQQD
ncbi:hypothetical protein M670_03809 [Schinkia azotoformans MEV2011]|uniref:Uncharacterized protein n=1 Tax=Schinkia azotoformans MEV2011 TaxID=1348973 RepID=A0A072NUG6_SCHAZ|nr:hypothetical protein [Schinkia azotoformans]KEF36895.1 hypothetical protein M670_03809 [Schinkia azotoformans MEV2011]MEC1697076.1 hypothetical protein [Schinkia azotoformans]MEC1717827.1 hypothetical protein [Schinkia azotoformans]MEC1726369.1 hypothetical protein [Schinkia azotoformans]MEC1739676.1 hypothetical protein [Schinkia azotoformans]